MQRRNVVLPQPDGPMMTTISPSVIVSEHPETAVRSPKRFVSRSTRSNGDTAASRPVISGHVEPPLERSREPGEHRDQRIVIERDQRVDLERHEVDGDD